MPTCLSDYASLPKVGALGDPTYGSNVSIPTGFNTSGGVGPRFINPCLCSVGPCTAGGRRTGGTWCPNFFYHDHVLWTPVRFVGYSRHIPGRATGPLEVLINNHYKIEETAMTKVKLIPVYAMLPLCLQVGAAVAQEPARARASILEEVIVTAQRREENVQDVGIAVTAMSGDQLREFNFQDAQRITDQTPNFSAGGLGGPSGPPFFVVRGISFVDFSNVNESSVGMYMDDVYLASQGAGAMQLFDLERVEILRGPQGTLFGRNTTAGVAQFVSKQPTEEFEGQGSLQYGQNNQVIGELGFGGPLSDSVRGRIALKYNKDDGWQENKISGKDVAATDAHALRGILDVDLNEQWMMQL